jgi:hypothetical protein
MLDFLFNSDFYIKILLVVVLLGASIFEVVLFNRLRIMNKLLQHSANRILEIIVGTLFLITITLLLTSLVIL